MAIAANQPITKTGLAERLLEFDKALLDKLPNTPADVVDQWIFDQVELLAMQRRGSGFLAMRANQRLERLRTIPYADIRRIACNTITAH